MKKLIFIIPVLLTLPSYADIASGANSATCDNSTIGATEGSTDLEANWNANTITIDWYNGDTKITTNTCSYDGAVTIPATPTRAGYTFNGWRVRTAAKQCWEITNQTECEASSGCVYSALAGDTCRATVADCGTLNNQADCEEHYVVWDGSGTSVICRWSNGTCISNGGGGTND